MMKTFRFKFPLQDSGGHIKSSAQEFDIARAYSIIISGNILSQIWHFSF